MAKSLNQLKLVEIWKSDRSLFLFKETWFLNVIAHLSQS